MNDEEIVLYFEERRLEKLKNYLWKSGTSVEHELQKLLDGLYAQAVPEQERMELESQLEIEKELAAVEREAARRFAVIHFHEGDEDYFFTSELRDSFYGVANLYRSTLKDEIGKYPLESIALCGFAGCQPISDMTFSALCEDMPDDQRVTALIEFDFDGSTVSVCERDDAVWKTYNLEDVSTAMYKAERKAGLSLDSRHEIFATALEGKEIVFGPDADESPVLRM